MKYFKVSWYEGKCQCTDSFRVQCFRYKGIRGWIIAKIDAFECYRERVDDNCLAVSIVRIKETYITPNY